MRIYTRKGDTGTTGLLFGGERISKVYQKSEVLFDLTNQR